MKTPMALQLRIPIVCAALGLGSLLSAPVLFAQGSNPPIAATQAFDAPACSDKELGGVDINLGPFGIQNVPSPYRTDPEWKAIILDATQPPYLQPPQILEGFITATPSSETSKDQAPTEVAEEDISWTHYTHDYTFKVTPDPAYQGMLASWTRFPGAYDTPLVTSPDQNGCPAGYSFVPDPSNPDPLAGSCVGCPNNEFLTANGCQVAAPEVCPDGSMGTTCVYQDMEVEWDNASYMDEKEGFQRIWGAVPEFVWPAGGDRVWVQGRWIFDCGHPGGNAKYGTQYVRFSTEIHPPRAVVTYRLNHPALDSFPRSRTSAPNFPSPQSYLPVTGVPVDSSSLPAGVPNSGPTNVPLTEADIFVTVNGGAANDVCSIVPYPCSTYGGHTGPIIAVNDRNYVFDIYPPGTNFNVAANALVNGTFPVTPPVTDASLQWRTVDHSSELPAHTCGGTDSTSCVTVNPIICLIDSTTPPPNQTETGCPALPAQPTRVRVILPFSGTQANFFAQSVLVGWDDVPAPANNTPGVRTFQVQFDRLSIVENGEGCCTNGDWRVFVNVGGQWRYMSPFFDTNALSGQGIFGLDGGSNSCHGDRLTSNGEGDCFQFHNTPFTVSVQDGAPIHVGVGGFEARGLEDSGSALHLCRNYPGGCNSPTSFGITDEPFLSLPFSNDDRIGTYEFDLVAPDYAAPAEFTTKEFDCDIEITLGGCHLEYKASFLVKELAAATAPASAPLVVGTPSFAGGAGIFIAAGTPMIPQTADSNTEGFQYRFHKQGAPLFTYSSTPFPVHWAHVDLAPGIHSASVPIGGANVGDGPYDFQYSAQSFGNLLEPRHTSTVILDTTPPVTTITQPGATQYPHSATLTLNYSTSDGNGSGVKSVTPTMDGAGALPDGTPLGNGQSIFLFSEMTLGTHTFAVDSLDNVNNEGKISVTFSIVVTFDSLKGDVNQLLALGCIDNQGIGQALISKISAAQNAYNQGQAQTAANILAALLKQLQAQTGKHISTQCKDPSGHQFNPALLLIGDAQYLQGTLGAKLNADPVFGSVMNAANLGVGGAIISVVDSSKTVIATAITDVTGFYYFPVASVWTLGSNYTVKVSPPSGYKSSSPGSQSFGWKAQMVTIGSFVLN